MLNVRLWPATIPHFGSSLIIPWVYSWISFFIYFSFFMLKLHTGVCKVNFFLPSLTTKNFITDLVDSFLSKKNKSKNGNSYLSITTNCVFLPVVCFIFPLVLAISCVCWLPVAIIIFSRIVYLLFVFVCNFQLNKGKKWQFF